MIFGHVPTLREYNQDEQIDKSLVETWKSYQKKLSEAADFVAQHTLSSEQRLRNQIQVRRLRGHIDQVLALSLINPFLSLARRRMP